VRDEGWPHSRPCECAGGGAAAADGSHLAAGGSSIGHGPLRVRAAGIG
jgi:hypothetical protein